MTHAQPDNTTPIEGIDVPKVTAWLAQHTEISAPLQFKLIAGGFECVLPAG